MRARTAYRLWLAMFVVCFVAILAEAHAQAPKGARLVVDNRTSQPATVFIWRYDRGHWDWQSVTSIGSGHWVPVYDVREGERLLARLANGKELDHTVKLLHDSRTNTLQDVWWLK
jgi:hypothetical protein